MTDTPHFWEELEAKLKRGILGLPWPWLPGIQDFAHREPATLDSLLAQPNNAPLPMFPSRPAAWASSIFSTAYGGRPAGSGRPAVPEGWTEDLQENTRDL